VTLSKESTPSLGIRLLSDLREVFGDHDEFWTKTILKALHELPEAPWADLGGKELNDRGLAARLRRYEITSKQVREDGVTQLRGYRRALSD